ncbi:class F sortase [Ornithinimicrobium faecis]|uniref:Class F sortase n=1 Tax=Ornithinimicrobium faecis TaxID=2934158 RepID=A0ABY4YPP2_9MICO|nr:class F sortase [Ornithinimicrobium sp. HY1793]USQ78746.1 class F sortase [Ornithinimicrobium sp. HY1793]
MSAPRPPTQARRRAVYRRRRIVVAVLALALLVGLFLGGRAIVLALSGGGESAAAQPLSAADQAVRMELPTSDAAVALRPAGVNESNRIDPEPGEAVWYTGHDRVRPGELGTAVVVGHAEQDGEPDAFADLATITEGERVTITFADGVTLQLDVSDVQVLAEDELQDSDLVWGPQQQTHRTVLVTSDQVEVDGREGHVVVVAELG